MNTAQLREMILKEYTKLADGIYSGWTAESVATAIGHDPELVKKQCIALKDAGFLIDTTLRRPTLKGTRAPVYRATDKARQLYPNTKERT